MAPAYRRAYPIYAWLLWVAGCSRATQQRSAPIPSRTRIVVPCEGAITVTVSPGTAPRFTWTPDCTVTSVAVQTADAAATVDSRETVWRYHIPDPRSIGSGIEYGKAPADAVVDIPPRTLHAGRRYLVTIRNAHPGGRVLIAAEGTATFTP